MNQYCSSLTRYNRFSTREVKIGDVPLGGSNPIRIQSMTTTDTMNTIATVEQTIRMVDAGCEYVRITAPSIHEAQNLAEIKKELRKRGCRVPLIADIHFTPNAAELAARIVEKVRVNPGNYADKKRFKKIDFTEDEYQAELERIRERFTPLVKICKEYGTAMRIGTNHGSLSDRIMSRYGDTPLGMVESALEFLRICEDLNYYDVVLSMKASNTRVMVQAYRLLVKKMSEAGMNYPLHLGVTEAGDGEDGRTKSAVGIGTLLEDGLGDTIRVSLTEDPEHESPVAIKLAERYKNRSSHSDIPPVMNIPFDPFTYNKRKSFSLKGLGDDNVPRVFVDLSRMEIKAPEDLETAGYSYNAETDKWTLADSAADFIYAGRNELPFELPMNLNAVYDYSFWLKMENKTGYPLLSFDEYVSAKEKSSELNFVVTSVYDIKRLEVLKEDVTAAVVLVTDNLHGMAEQRRIFFELSDKGINNPVVIKRSYGRLNQERFMLYSSTDFGALLIDGFGDGLWAEVSLEEVPQQQEGLKAVNRILFGILQASRLRISRTEYIACPSCGRTLFDLQSVTAQIRKRTGHLKGVKIGIMGCIVNGPGEMADADYGYVGSGPGKITLYRGQNIVKRSIDSESAVDELIELIKEDNRWEEPRRL
ncbi:MAG: (E)-4-hydroxy-3-methylbut-2-enyl-diphosphate synthase [Ignavibacteria bacterium]|nr:(E)-4-hydroxy-3-methylbut-2-enyl-diphosphate synthase [Ignavibacteria bacterium]MCU7503512.1 (E)-4-hydroxy-3-methylbut-2-enyl-diphosphate synthase [Ignavibacteria bacterium]MCU7517258.1 (E)-4-hydroxy-3-methylbut-2-enyl-diphosphate synthase [Ignavibacteria bacterium]